MRQAQTLCCFLLGGDHLEREECGVKELLGFVMKRVTVPNYSDRDLWVDLFRDMSLSLWLLNINLF